MTEVLLFHHAQGQTMGFLAFADELRRAGPPCMPLTSTMVVLLPRWMRVSPTPSMSASARSSSGGVRVADGLPNGLIYAGFSLGVLPAPKLAQTRPGGEPPGGRSQEAIRHSFPGKLI